MEPQIAVCTRSLEQERFNEPQVVGAQDEGRKGSLKAQAVSRLLTQHAPNSRMVISRRDMLGCRPPTGAAQFDAHPRHGFLREEQHGAFSGGSFEVCEA